MTELLARIDEWDFGQLRNVSSQKLEEETLAKCLADLNNYCSCSIIEGKGTK